MCTDINANGGAAAVLTIGTSGLTYCLSKALNTGSLYQCIDSTGAVKTSTTAICAIGVYACPN